MFSNQINVNGTYVNGTVKRNDDNKDFQRHPYMFFSGLNFGSRGSTTWTSDQLRQIADELLTVANEIDKQNTSK